MEELKKQVDAMLAEGREPSEVALETGAAYAYVVTRKSRLKNYAARKDAEVLGTVRQIARGKPEMPVSEALAIASAARGLGND